MIGFVAVRSYRTENISERPPVPAHGPCGVDESSPVYYHDELRGINRLEINRVVSLPHED